MPDREARLLEVLRALPDAHKQSLLDYAEFLASRGAPAISQPRKEAGKQEATVSQEPLPIERPAQESVIKAVRRLMQTYPMLDRNKLLNETSGFVTQHVIHGRTAVEVIDEMEVMFARYYEEFKAGQ